MERLSLAQARRAVIAAQGLSTPPPATAGMRQLQSLINRLGQFQIDSVNVVQRAHYLPIFSRLGAYDPKLLDRAAGKNPRRLFEYLGHAASFIDSELFPALQPRMVGGLEKPWPEITRIERESPNWIEEVYQAVAAQSGVTARDLDTGKRERVSWGWNWSDTKLALEWLWRVGRISPLYRNSQFERVFDLTERVLPSHILSLPALNASEAHHVLVARAARALGVASDRCLADYFRLSLAQTHSAIDELVAAGLLLPVTVSGWQRPTYRWHDAVIPRRVNARALLSPFDNLIFERERLLALFGSHYRIEIYVPAAQRVWGYYVYLFLLEDQIAARVDLKADRLRDQLVIQAAWCEPSNPATPTPLEPSYVAAQLAIELFRMASWLGLTDVRVNDRGDLAAALTHALG